jgi:hypothetical protein
MLVHSEGSLDKAPGRSRHVGLYWAMDPVARLSAATGVLESGGPARVDAGSVVDPARMRSTPVSWPDSVCDRFDTDIDTWFTDGLPARGELREDPRAELPLGPVGRRLPSLGLLGHDALLVGADFKVSGVVTPDPVRRSGRCAVSSFGNWGAPLDSSDPCFAYKPIVSSEGSLIVDGGQGQGVLLISGDAVFRSTTRYFGLVVVAGDLKMAQGSEIHGLVRVRGGVILRDGSRIVGSACALVSALDAAKPLRSMIPIPGSDWPDSR